ncbi:DNA-binding response regulator [Dysgonomonas sp. 216]|uniref:response regulator transcription factor n=1 Tax=Dysgonomonas sp. 216 TaxID=2302934 RepID=UPI0013D5C346|nr:LuxR C-terminal-related transcriptional regulator [Dysgonomonas sp. 216]NDW17527.1 DNA-binding response regulator [Dysgonomonas sp. 216]
MLNSKKILAVAETSYIIRKGLVYALSQFPLVAKVVELREHEDLAYQLNLLKPDALLINPMLLGNGLKQDIKTQLKLDKDVAVIALVYNLIDEQFYRSYDGIIKINDSESKIEEILSNCLNEPTANSEQEELSDREKDILVSIVKGMSNKEVADFHNISIHTVITHRRNIGRKLGIHSVSGLTVYAILNKFVDIKEITL